MGYKACRKGVRRTRPHVHRAYIGPKARRYARRNWRAWPSGTVRITVRPAHLRHVRAFTVGAVRRLVVPRTRRA